MKTHKSLYPICFAVLLLFPFEVAVRAGSSKSQTVTPEGWPTKLGLRKLYPTKYGFVYASRKSSVSEINKIIRNVVKELDEDSKKTTMRGLVIVMDNEEKPLFKEEDMIKLAQKADGQKEGQELEEAQKSHKEGKKQLVEMRLDMNLLLSIKTMPIEPNMLPELVDGFEKDVDRQIDWCVTIPTEEYIRSTIKKTFDAGLKKEKIGIVKRAAMFTLLAYAKRKSVGLVKKSRRLALYQLIVDKQEHLTEEQKEDMKKAYEERL